MRLNIGCGASYVRGWTNCDVQAIPGKIPPDILCDARQVPLAGGVADELSAFHLIEHFARYEAPDVLAEWRRLLKSGGRLILELPNLEAACRNLLAGCDDSLGLRPIYGDWTHRDPYMLHKHGYTPKTIAALLKECGFVQIEIKPPQTHGRQANRDMRVEAVRG